MHKQPLLAGFDPGNSQSTLMISDGGAQAATLTMPSFVGSGSLAEIQRIRGGIGADALQADEFVLEHGGLSYTVGRLSHESSDATSQRGDVARYWNGHTLRILLTLIGGIVNDEAVRVRVVTGLPVRLRSKEHAQQVQASLGGEHVFVLNGRRRTVQIEVFAALMEGGAASFVYGKRKEPHGIIDVGGRTTDLYWANGQRPVWDRCHGAAIGIEKAGDLLRQSIFEASGRELDADEVQQVLRAFAAQKPLPTFYASGSPITLNGHVERSVQRVADEVLSLVSQHWRSADRGAIAAEAAQIVLIGGGAHYVGPALHPHLPHLVVPAQPELANAEGYLAFARQMTEEQWTRV